MARPRYLGHVLISFGLSARGCSHVPVVIWSVLRPPQASVLRGLLGLERQHPFTRISADAPVPSPERRRLLWEVIARDQSVAQKGVR